MKQERTYKTVEVKAKSGRVYRRPPNTPAPKFRGQRFTLLKDDLAQIRLELTEAEYRQAQEAIKDMAKAFAVGPVSVPDAIIAAAQVSLHVMHSGKFSPRPADDVVILKKRKSAGRPVEFKGGRANVVLKLPAHTAALLHARYEDYCVLCEVQELPRTGPVWAAFLHGVQVIRQALEK